MAFILRSIATEEYGINDTIDHLDYLRTQLNAETDRFGWGHGNEDDWNDAAQQLNDAIFEAQQYFGANVGSWSAWFMFELARWIENGWGDTEWWLRGLHALAYRVDYVGAEFFDMSAPVQPLLASNVLHTLQEGWELSMCDEPALVLAEVHRTIGHHYRRYDDVLVELTAGRYWLRPIADLPPSPRYAPSTLPPLANTEPQSPVVQRGGALTPEWSAPAVYVPPTVAFPNKDRIVTDVKDMLADAERAWGTCAKVPIVIAIYKYLWEHADFVRAFPLFRTTTMLKLIEFADCGDARRFDSVAGSLTYTELCDHSLAAWSDTGVPVPRGYRQVAFSCLRADKTLGVNAPRPVTGKAAKISIAVHLDRLEEHMVALAPTLAELTRNGRRLRSGVLLSAEPIALPNHVVPSVTHEVVVLVPGPMAPPGTPPGTPPVEVRLFFGGGRPELDGGDEPTDPRPLVVYDDDFLDIEYAGPAAPAPRRSPSPYAEDFEAIEYNSDSDGDVFDDCDSEAGWERVHAHHRDAALGLIE